ncbi:hypothetical protein AA2016_1518 [Aminobacter aminovorans]|uniref:Uncharacterized protein n=1 Tax=Aminobacter aminovorans TaxID=83263 RepID=A0AAC8YL43_AMIAI|nr:hypothetical protein AA2016_1518 [Aminobacter aminovorans]
MSSLVQKLYNSKGQPCSDVNSQPTCHKNKHPERDFGACHHEFIVGSVVRLTHPRSGIELLGAFTAWQSGRPVIGHKGAFGVG